MVTVVLADDNPKILEILATFLPPAFSIVAKVDDGELALEAIKELRPRLAILDVSMPKINGLEVARRLIEAKSSTKVVFLTLLCGPGVYRRSATMWTRLHLEDAVPL
jgi:CheY-like chemotaxis protein